MINNRRRWLLSFAKWRINNGGSGGGGGDGGGDDDETITALATTVVIAAAAAALAAADRSAAARAAAYAAHQLIGTSHFGAQNVQQCVGRRMRCLGVPSLSSQQQQ